MAKETTNSTFRVEALLSDQQSENLVEQTVSILKEEGAGYGLTVSGDNPVFVQAVREGGPAERVGVRPGDRILMVNDRCVSKLGHVEVVQLIKAAKLVNLRLLARKALKTSISLPILPPMTKQGALDQLVSAPIDPTATDKQRTVELKSSTLERMLKQEQQFYKDRCNEYTKSPSTQLEKEIQDSSGRIETLEKQLTASGETIEPPQHKPVPVVSQAASTSEEPSNAAMVSVERHPVANGASVSTNDVEVKKMTPVGKRKKSDSGDKRLGRLRLLGFKSSHSTESLASKPKKTSLSLSETPSSLTLNNGHVVGVNDENQMHKSVRSASGVSETSQDSVATISIDASDEDECLRLDDDSTGPFSDLALLERSPAHLAVFLNFLISKSSHNPNSLFFYLISGVYQRHHGSKELKRMANELYLTFFQSTAPLKLDIDPSLRRQIESTLKLKSSSDDSLRSLFNKAREYVYVLVSQQLSGFRAMRTLGLGSMFGDTALSDGSSRNGHIEVVCQLLVPHLQHLAVNHGEESAEKRCKREATASCLAVFLQDIGVKMKLKTDSNRLSSFVSSVKLSKSSSIFKNKKVHVINGHEFVANHYHYPTFCDHCGGLLWGFGFQGYQCQVCGFNVHKQSCNSVLTGKCEGPGRKTPMRIGSLWVDLNKRKRTSTKRDKGSRQSSEADSPLASTDHEDGFFKKEDEESDVSLLKAGSLRDGRVTSLVKSYEQKSASVTPMILANGKSLSSGAGMGSEEDMERALQRSRGNSLCVSHLQDRPHKEKKGQIGRSRSLKLPESEKNRLFPHRFSGATDHSVSMINLRDDDATIDENGRSQRSPSIEDQEILQDEDMAMNETLTPWVELVDKSVWKDMSSGEIKRQEVIHELFHTEKTHLKKLKTIYYVFYVPLQAIKHITPERVDQLFPNLMKIIEIHGYIVRGMKDRFAECSQQGETPGCLTSVGDIMLSMFDSPLGDALIEACSEFVLNQTASLEFIKATRSKSKDFDRFIQQCEANPFCSRLQISQLMSTVIARLTKYPLLLEKILKYTDESDPDYAFVGSALEASRDALVEVNEQMTLAENQQFLKDVQRKLDTSPLEKAALQLEETKNFSLIADGRDLVYDGHLSWRIVKNRTTNVYALLLSDMLVLLEHNEDKDRYLLKPRPDPNIKSDRSPIITFRDFLVRDVATDSKAFFVLSTSSGGPQIHELVAHSVSERETWIMKLKEAANSWKYAEKAGSVGQRVLVDRRRRYSTPEKLAERASVSDSEKDSLEVEHETADQIQERLRRRTDFIALSLERKAALLHRLQEVLADKSDQSEVSILSQSERRYSVEEASLGMRYKVLSSIEQADVVTGLVNQLVGHEETSEKDTDAVHQPNFSVLQDLLSATAALNRRLAQLLEQEMPDETSLFLSEREDSIGKTMSLQRPRSQVISESRKSPTDSFFPALTSPDTRNQSPSLRQHRISPAILELQQSIEHQLTPTSSPLLERRKIPTPVPELHREEAVDVPAVDATPDSNETLETATSNDDKSVNFEGLALVDADDGQTTGQTEDVEDVTKLEVMEATGTPVT